MSSQTKIIRIPGHVPTAVISEAIAAHLAEASNYHFEGDMLTNHLKDIVRAAKKFSITTVPSHAELVKIQASGEEDIVSVKFTGSKKNLNDFIETEEFSGGDEKLSKLTQDKVGLRVKEAKNHLGEREFQTYDGWRAAVRKIDPKAKIDGDKDIATAIHSVTGRAIGEWGGDVGSIYKEVVKESMDDAAILAKALNLPEDEVQEFLDAKGNVTIKSRAKASRKNIKEGARNAKLFHVAKKAAADLDAAIKAFTTDDLDAATAEAGYGNGEDGTLLAAKFVKINEDGAYMFTAAYDHTETLDGDEAYGVTNVFVDPKTLSLEYQGSVNKTFSTDKKAIAYVNGKGKLKESAETETFDIKSTKGMNKDEAQKKIDAHYHDKLTYDDREFFDSIYMNQIIGVTRKEIPEFDEWEEDGYKEKERVWSQESYLGYIPDKDLFVSGWDIGSEAGHQFIFVVKVDNTGKARVVKFEDAFGKSYSSVIDAAGARYMYPKGLKAIHAAAPTLIDIRLD